MTSSNAEATSPRFKTLIQAARFGAVGVLNTGIDYAILLALVNFAHMPSWAANIFAYGVAATNSFLINRYWTFAVRTGPKSVRREAGVFAGVTLLGFAISEVTLLAMEPLIGLPAAKGVSILIVFASTFWLNKRVTFRA